MREQLCNLLALHAGQTITRELAVEMVHALFPPEAAQVQPSQMVQAPGTGKPVTIEQIRLLESHILQGEQVETPTKHYFAPGLYAREQFIPAGTVLTGAVHKTEHLSVFVGDITVWTEDGMVRLTGHHTFVSKPGAKRAGYAHSDTWCTGFFPSDKTDLDELEHDLAETPQLLQTKLQRIEQLSSPSTLLLEN